MDYIDILLIMEDDLDDEVESLGEFGESCNSENPFNPDEPSEPTEQSTPTTPNPSQDTSYRLVPDWCKCGKCRPMPQEVENKCCMQKKCITQTSRFAKLCLEDNSTRAF